MYNFYIAKRFGFKLPMRSFRGNCPPSKTSRQNFFLNVRIWSNKRKIAKKRGRQYPILHLLVPTGKECLKFFAFVFALWLFTTDLECNRTMDFGSVRMEQNDEFQKSLRAYNPFIATILLEYVWSKIPYL